MGNSRQVWTATDGRLSPRRQRVHAAAVCPGGVTLAGTRQLTGARTPSSARPRCQWQDVPQNSPRPRTVSPEWAKSERYPQQRQRSRTRVSALRWQRPGLGAGKLAPVGRFTATPAGAFAVAEWDGRERGSLSRVRRSSKRSEEDSRLVEPRSRSTAAEVPTRSGGCDCWGAPVSGSLPTRSSRGERVSLQSLSGRKRTVHLQAVFAPI
jgi:hypothetical protein